jgi:hypothetical protein
MFDANDQNRIPAVRLVRTLSGFHKVSDAEVVKSVDSLDEPSVYAAKQWRFEPARLDGQPIRSKASISFVYDRGLFPPTKPKK